MGEIETKLPIAGAFLALLLGAVLTARLELLPADVAALGPRPIRPLDDAQRSTSKPSRRTSTAAPAGVASLRSPALSFHERSRDVALTRTPHGPTSTQTFTPKKTQSQKGTK